MSSETPGEVRSEALQHYARVSDWLGSIEQKIAALGEALDEPQRARVRALVTQIDAGTAAAKSRLDRFQELNGDPEIVRLQAKDVKRLSPKERRYAERWMRAGRALIREDEREERALMRAAADCDRLLFDLAPTILEGQVRLVALLEARQFGRIRLDNGH